MKDNLDTAGPASNAGSFALASEPPRRDALVVGGVILGKTNLSEWANFRSACSTSGWSAVDGPTRNPFALDRSPRGSSLGSGTAVVAGRASARQRSPGSSA
ncbi:MAG TPA: amidase family protein [Acidimicrobiales bacterium]|nr:amidase family protein [Acidimicrobiales bacterium]